MTTDETNNAEEAEEKPVKRDVAELLALSTYQGMTDEEIESVFEHKLNLARMDEEANANRVTAQANIEEIRNACTQMTEDSANVLQSILDTAASYSSPTLESV